MSHTIYFIHADTSMRERYAAALAPIGDFEILQVPIAGALSSSYEQLAASMKRNGRLLPSSDGGTPPHGLEG